jgi:RNA polymerase sigma factor (sigma-70 family)
VRVLSVHEPASKLIAACLRGEQRAWNELVDQYGRLVYSIPRRYRLSDSDADDVFQAVFLNLYRNLDHLRDGERLSAWLITTTHRECWRVGKASSRYVELDAMIPDVGSPSDEQIADWEQQHLIRQALADIGGRCEALLKALFLDRLEPSYEEIAARIGIPIGSIGPTRARCLEKLARRLAPVVRDAAD